MYLFREVYTPLKPVSLPADSSTRPSCFAASIACSAVRSTLASCPAAAALAAPFALCRATSRAACCGVTKVPRFRTMSSTLTFAMYLFREVYTPLKPVSLPARSSTRPSCFAASIACSAVRSTSGLPTHVASRAAAFRAFVTACASRAASRADILASSRAASRAAILASCSSRAASCAASCAASRAALFASCASRASSRASSRAAAEPKRLRAACA